MNINHCFQQFWYLSANVIKVMIRLLDNRCPMYATGLGGTRFSQNPAPFALKARLGFTPWSLDELCQQHEALLILMRNGTWILEWLDMDKKWWQCLDSENCEQARRSRTNKVVSEYTVNGSFHSFNLNCVMPDIMINVKKTMEMWFCQFDLIFMLYL